MRNIIPYRFFILAMALALANSSFAQCDQNYDWAVWDGFTGDEATGTISTPNGPISVTMSANYSFTSTPDIFNYGVFTAFNDPPPNATTPRTTWAAGAGGETTMCFSETVSNPVLLLSSVGNAITPVTLEFSLAYNVIFDGGGMVFPDDMTVIGTEGYAILVFPGDFDCVTIYSNTPEDYTNITWGVQPPLFEVDIEGDTIACVSTTLTASGGLTYEWNGGQNPNSPSNTFTSTGNYQLTVTDAAGCTVVTSINVAIHPEAEENLHASICEGESYFFDGQDLDQPGYYEAPLQTQYGCDSIVGLTLDVWPIHWEDLTAVICEGETYEFDFENLDQPGFYIAELQNQWGCDSTVTLELIVLPTSTEPIDLSICEGDTLDFHGQGLTQAGIYNANLQNQFGCDSTVILTLDLLPSTSHPLTANICEGEDYLFQGDTLTQAGIYPANLMSSQGCDSTILLTLEVLQTSSSTQEATFCQGNTYLFQGDTLFSPGEYTYTLSNQLGCDSTIILDLVEFPAHVVPLQAQICAGQTYSFQGMDLDQPGMYIANLQTYQGCDSTIQLTLDVVQEITYADYDSICQGDTYMFNGQPINTAGLYLDTLVSSGGCDSIVSLTLAVLDNPSTDLEAEICEGESYIFQGDTLITPGQVTKLLSSWAGCDSTINLNLTVYPNIITPVQAQICTGQSYYFDGMTLTNPGQYVDILQTSHGCDSVIELTLTVATLLETTLDASICEGESYSFGTEQLTTPGIYLDSLSSAGGCDSLVTLNLSVNLPHSESYSVNLCEGEHIIFEGDTLMTGGQYSAMFQTTAGCDSNVILQLSVHPSYDQVDLIQACDSYTWPVNGQTYTQNTSLTLPAQSIYGCDSSRQLILTIQPSWEDVDSVTINGSDYLWPVDNNTYSQSGTYTANATTTGGCDSIHILHLTLVRTGIYIPTAFSPNDDGINDRFTIYGGEDLKLIESMTIYDRWGNKLATYADIPPGDPSYGWDGKSRGITLDPQVYVFTASLLMSDESRLFVKGEITVVK